MAEVQAALDAAAATELGAFWAVDREGAGAAAEALGAFPGHKRGGLRLGGVPVAVKDCFDLAGLPTSSGVSGAHEPAQADAEAVRRLREAGAVPIGKTAMDQLGWSLAGAAPGFAPCLNPIDTELSPGGSSCGSAAAVAAGITALGIGTDVAGSTRVPAAFCGIVGLKPPFGSVPLAGVASFVPSFDLAGVLARSVRECVEAYEVLSGQAAPHADGELRIALVEDHLEASDPEVAAVVERAVEQAFPPGFTVGRVRLDWNPPRFGRVLSAELARTWGDEVERTPERFTADIRQSVAHGRTITDADLDAARDELAESAYAVERRLSEWDVLVCPTVPTPVPSRRDPGTVAELTPFTRPFSALHWPAFSVPGGVDARGRPVGVQLAASDERFGALIAAAELVAA
jgi:aspartyl-tRNA(Asn)/glutamyl-tRNA(Gln) amidotransferase subunit A